MAKKSFMDSYVKVNDRIIKFREEFPEGFISTEQTKNGTEVNFIARVFRNSNDLQLFADTGISAATGHSCSYIDEEDPEKCVEKGETVAIGRALGILGFEITKSIATEEEIENFEEKKAKKSKLSKLSKVAKKEEVEEESVEETPTEKSANKLAKKSGLKKTGMKKSTSNIEEVEETEEEEVKTTKRTGIKLARKSKSKIRLKRK